MPRYYFHLREKGAFTEDVDGVVLPDDAAAHAEAVQAARESLAECILAGNIVDGQEFLIYDESGKQILTMPLKAVLHLE